MVRFCGNDYTFSRVFSSKQENIHGLSATTPGMKMVSLVHRFLQVGTVDFHRKKDALTS